MTVTIYHNPRCSASRATLAAICNAGIEPVVVEYLKAPPSRATLERLIAGMGMPVRAVMREKEAIFAELGLGDPKLTDAQLIDAMAAHPILINRPIVASEKGVRLCRPPAVVLEILPAAPNAAIAEQNGD